jgi:hypothetical protein
MDGVVVVGEEVDIMVVEVGVEVDMAVEDGEEVDMAEKDGEEVDVAEADKQLTEQKNQKQKLR